VLREKGDLYAALNLGHSRQDAALVQRRATWEEIAVPVYPPQPKADEKTGGTGAVWALKRSPGTLWRAPSRGLFRSSDRGAILAW